MLYCCASCEAYVKAAWAFAMFYGATTLVCWIKSRVCFWSRSPTGPRLLCFLRNTGRSRSPWVTLVLDKTTGKRREPGHNQRPATRQPVHRVTGELVWSTQLQEVSCRWQARSCGYFALRVHYCCSVLFVNTGRASPCSKQHIFLCNYQSCQARPDVLL